MNCPTPQRLRPGFTLIELLVVISVIAILAAIAVPGVNRALDSAKKTEASTVCSSVNIAINQFIEEYKVPPADWSEAMTNTTAGFMDHLTGKNDSINKAKQRYYEGKTAKNNVNGLSPDNGNLYDPWGLMYQAAVDADGDGEIALPAGYPTKSIHGESAVQSAGRDGNFAQTQDNAKSW